MKTFLARPIGRPEIRAIGPSIRTGPLHLRHLWLHGAISSLPHHLLATHVHPKACAASTASTASTARTASTAGTALLLILAPEAINLLLEAHGLHLHGLHRLHGLHLLHAHGLHAHAGHATYEATTGAATYTEVATAHVATAASAAATAAAAAAAAAAAPAWVAATRTATAAGVTAATAAATGATTATARAASCHSTATLASSFVRRGSVKGWGSDDGLARLDLVLLVRHYRGCIVWILVAHKGNALIAWRHIAIRELTKSAKVSLQIGARHLRGDLR